MERRSGAMQFCATQKETEADPENLDGASAEQLLHLALTCDSSGDVLVGGIQSVLVDLEVVYEALEATGERWAAEALHQAQGRLRVLKELARRRAKEERAKRAACRRP
jgi:hypothetical protein